MYFNIYIFVTKKNGQSLFGFDVYDSCCFPGCTSYPISAMFIKYIKYSFESTLRILQCTHLK